MTGTRYRTNLHNSGTALWSSSSLAPSRSSHTVDDDEAVVLSLRGSKRIAILFRTDQIFGSGRFVSDVQRTLWSCTKNAVCKVTDAHC